MRARADSALSHLYDGELCVASTADGEREVRWSVADWRFYYTDIDSESPVVCRFDDIIEWRPASIKF